ncbi:right-handed parallel beta-helix repeat-containing protein [Paenibacillus flagellatus]|uniref:Rhamnogalacturonase A/B/Epimerase-like pectate lyase domain-containing protein n=1 Tax=Paenibacillus flagellatus TaxID=2211139 RepID=A0A2V5KCD3_9BACL|nr:right-handed parallel beta-helix repeat-containing protein [Paenibacillus flagellatus]PYI57158.1 hypothetical protein DLM86_01580 [Paenibacillus flagellatus]
MTEPNKTDHYSKSRRKLLASLGAAGTAIAAGSLLNNNLYAQSVTNSVYGDNNATLTSASDGYVNVKDYWTDGSDTDATVAVQNAILAARGKSAVYFPPGQYIIKSQIELLTNDRLVGAGRNKSILKFPPNSDHTAIKLAGTSKEAGIQGVFIEDLGIECDGSSTNFVGIHMHYSHEGAIINCRIKGFQKGVLGTGAWTNTIGNCMIQNNSTNIELGYDSNFFVIRDTILDNAGEYGFRLTDNASAITLQGCQFQNNGKDGALLDSGKSVSFIGCYFEKNNLSNGPAGIADINIQGKVISTEIDQFVCGVLISGCQFWTSNAQASIWIHRAKGVTIDGCSINHPFPTKPANIVGVQTSDKSAQVFISGTYRELDFNDTGKAITAVATNDNTVLRNNVSLVRDYSRFAVNTPTAATDAKLSLGVGGTEYIGLYVDTGGHSYMTKGADPIMKLANNATGDLTFLRPIGLNQSVSANVPNGSLFVDSADGKLKFKNHAGVVNSLY